MNKKEAYTLQEVIITLLILGTVATMVISSVVNNYNQTVAVTKLKKTYSDMVNSFRAGKVNQGCTNVACVSKKNRVYGGQEANKVNIRNLKPYFPYIVEDTKKRCVPSYVYSLNGNKYGTSQGYDEKARKSFCLNSKDDIGIKVWDYTFTTGYKTKDVNEEGQRWVTCDRRNMHGDNGCGRITVYLGGGKKKAVMGRNTFEFILLGDGDLVALPTDCDPNRNSKMNGLGCFDRIRRNNWRIDY